MTITFRSPYNTIKPVTISFTKALFKYDNPHGGFDAEVTNANYSPNGNKLTNYNIIISMDGAKDLIDIAIANIDFKRNCQAFSCGQLAMCYL